MNALALIVVLLAGQADTDIPPQVRANARLAGSVTRGWFSESGVVAPDCRLDPTCMGYCGVGVYDGGTEWQCVAGPATDGGYAVGDAVAVTQGTGATYEGGPFELTDGGAYSVASDITDAKAPFVAAAEAQRWLGSTFWSGDHTVVVVVSPTQTSTTNPVILSHGALGSDGFVLQAIGTTQTNCIYSGPTRQDVARTGSSAIQRWQVISCRKSGSTYTARNAGTDQTAAVTQTAVNPASRNLYFGRYDSAASSMRGNLWRTYFYNADKGTTLASTEAGVWGAYTNRGVVTDTRSGQAWACLADGYCYAWGDNAPRVDPRYGILSFEQRTNLLLDPSDFTTANWSTWNGSETVTANTWDFDHTTSGDTITDADAVNQQGRKQDYTTSTTGAYTASCRMQSGTSTRTTLFLQFVGGTGNASCSFSDLSPTTQEKTCTATGGGAMTAVRLGVVVGTVGSDTGSIKVGACKLERATFSGPPILTGNTTVNADALTVSTTGWPTASGEISFDYTPLNSGPPSTSLESRLLSTNNATTAGIDILIDTAGALAVITTNSGTRVTSAALSWTAGVTYRIRVTWGGGTLSISRDRTTVASGSIGMPTAHSATAYVGHYYTGIAQANGYLKSLCVGLPGRCP